MKKLLIILVLAASAFYPLGEAEAASKHRVLMPVPAAGVDGFGGGFTIEDPQPPNNEIEFDPKLNPWLSLNYVGDYFFADAAKHALAFDFSAAQQRVQVKRRSGAIYADGTYNLLSIGLGYRYHFSGALESGGYVGFVPAYRSLAAPTDDNLAGGNGIAFVLNGGYDWHLRRGLIMGIHISYASPLDIGNIRELGGPMLAYSIGGSVK